MCLSQNTQLVEFISCCLRLMFLPEDCFMPQTMMSSREWEAELKCTATGTAEVLTEIMNRRKNFVTKF